MRRLLSHRPYTHRHHEGFHSFIIGGYAQTLLSHSCTLVALLALLFVCSPAAKAQTIVDTKLDRAEILIGQQARLSVTVTTDKGKKVEFPAYAPSDTLTAGIEVVRQAAGDTLSLNNGQRLQYNHTYYITSFDSALYSLPPFEVMVGGDTCKSRSRLGLKVVSVPVDTTKLSEFAPPYYISTSSFEWRNSLLLLSLLLWPLLFLIVFIGAKLSERKPTMKRVVIEPPTPPYKKAVADLTELKSNTNRSMDTEENKQFLSDLAFIVRRFIQERFSINALESTTGEIIEKLAPLISREDSDSLQEILSSVDFVKYAKHTTTSVERERYVRMAEDFLLSTRDEEMEQPKPIVKMVVYSDKKRHQLRIALWIALLVATIAEIALLIHTIISFHAVYLS